jgi:hypothetical protein
MSGTRLPGGLLSIRRRRVSNTIVVFSLSNDIFEGCARSDSNNAKIHHQVEVAVIQAFPGLVGLLLKISAPKLPIGSVELIDNYIY